MCERRSSHTDFGQVGVVVFVAAALLIETDKRLTKNIGGKKKLDSDGPRVFNMACCLQQWNRHVALLFSPSYPCLK